MRLNASSATVLSAVFLTATCLSAAGQDLRLVDAMKRRDLPKLQALLSQGVDVDVPQGDGATALHWAVYWDEEAAVDQLVAARANVNAVNDLGVTPLFLACSNVSGAIVKKLLAAGADPNRAATPTTTAETPLMAAARAGAVEVVRALLAHGANVNATERAHGQTALMWSAANGHSHVVQALIDAGADVHARSRLDPVHVMIGRSTEFLWGGSTALFFAARSGDIESAKRLLAAGANVNDVTPDQTSVLTFAAHSGHGVFAAYLLDHGADPNAAGSGYTALHAAVLRGDRALVTSLLARGADPNARLQQGTPVNRNSKDFALQTNWIGATPFWLAAKFAEPEILRALAAGGADSTVTTPDGSTPLMVAAGVGHSGRVGVDDRRGRRRDPLEIATARGSGDEERQALETVRTLIAIGVADINAANANGDTAMHGAVGSRHQSVVQWLAARGAKLDVKNRRGQTPMSIASARFRGQDDEGSVDTPMVELLERLGARQ